MIVSTQRNVAAGQRPVDRRAGHRAGVEVLAAPFGAGRQDRGGQVGWRRTRTARRPRRRRCGSRSPGRTAPQLLQQAGQFLPADLGQRAAGAEPGEQPVQHAHVAAADVQGRCCPGSGSPHRGPGTLQSYSQLVIPLVNGYQLKPVCMTSPLFTVGPERSSPNAVPRNARAARSSWTGRIPLPSQTDNVGASGKGSGVVVSEGLLEVRQQFLI
jgi:hypothetical protein